MDEEIRQFLAMVTAARGGDIGEEETAIISAWFTTVADSVNLINLVNGGKAIMYWDAKLNEPTAKLTTQGYKEAPQELQAVAVDKRSLN